MDYSKFNFPPYEYKEYPKWVDGKEGRVLVESAEEEASVTQGKRRRNQPSEE